MRILLAATIAVLVLRPAHAAPPEGMFEVVDIQRAGTRSDPLEELKKKPEYLQGRLVVQFFKDQYMVMIQVLGKTPRGPVVCQSRLTMAVSWKGESFDIPADAEATAQSYHPDTKEDDTLHCTVRMAQGRLTLLKVGPGEVLVKYGSTESRLRPTQTYPAWAKRTPKK